MFTSPNPAALTRGAIALGFLSFGLVSVATPDFLRALMVREAFQTGYPIVTLAIGALGAHALAAGAFALFARFKSWTYLGFALATAPIFVADYWLYYKAGAFNEMILLHAGGMLAMLALCVRGFRLTLRQEQALELAA